MKNIVNALALVVVGLFIFGLQGCERPCPDCPDCPTIPEQKCPEIQPLDLTGYFFTDFNERRNTNSKNLATGISKAGKKLENRKITPKMYISEVKKHYADFQEQNLRIDAESKIASKLMEVKEGVLVRPKGPKPPGPCNGGKCFDNWMLRDGTPLRFYAERYEVRILQNGTTVAQSSSEVKEVGGEFIRTFELNGTIDINSEITIEYLDQGSPIFSVSRELNMM